MILEKLGNYSEYIDGIIQDVVEIVNDATFSESLAQLGFLRRIQEEERTSRSQKKAPNSFSSSNHSEEIFSKETEKNELLEGFSEISLSDESFCINNGEGSKKEATPQMPPRHLLLSNIHSPATSEKTKTKDVPFDPDRELFPISELPEHLQEEGKRVKD